MGNTSISWCSKVWNVARGCSPVSEGCRNCFAQRQAHRFNFKDGPYEGLTRMTPSGPRWTGVIKVVEKHLDDPIHWHKPERIFVGSMTDLFHPKVPDSLVMHVWRIMRQTPRHTYLILTKRAERMRDWSHVVNDLPLANVHLGVSVETQAMADERLLYLRDTKAVVRWVSVEPMLGPVILDDWLFAEFLQGDITQHQERTLSWLVCGGESGPGYRPMDIKWVRQLQAQCELASVPFYVKQASALRPGQQGDIPDDLWALKEFPEVATCEC